MWVLLVIGGSLVITLAFQFIIWFENKQNNKDKEKDNEKES